MAGSPALLACRVLASALVEHECITGFSHMAGWGFASAYTIHFGSTFKFVAIYTTDFSLTFKFGAINNTDFSLTF